MYRRFLGIVAAMAIVLMVLPPLFDTFDTWDKAPELPVVGHNTETTLMVMGLEAGMGLIVAWASVLVLNWLAVMFALRTHEASVPAQPGVRATEYLLLFFSPPRALSSLRI